MTEPYDSIVPHMSGDRTLARSLLLQLLPDDGRPELGARLKQRMIEAFKQRGFSYPRLGKFSSFLAENSDIVDVGRDQIPGDMQVRRRNPEAAHGAQPKSPEAPPPERAPRLRADIWQALTNPDPSRRRFYSRSKNRVVHFRTELAEEVDKRIRDEVERSERDFVEIPFIYAETQKAWMRQFFVLDPLPGRMRGIFERLLELPYSSALNYAFTASLGERAESWRIFRSRMVHDAAQDWATRNGVSLLQGDQEQKAPAIEGSPEPVSVDSRSSHLRAALHRAIDSLSDTELERVLVPASALISGRG